MEIRLDDLRGTEIVSLLNAHLSQMYEWTPAASVHALDLGALRTPDISFWSVWDGVHLVGCGALRELDPTQGEIKSMHTAAAHRGRGVAARLVEHIVTVARERGYHLLSLETGAMPEFEPARSLYRRYGFVDCGPFGGYEADPNSAFMHLTL